MGQLASHSPNSQTPKDPEVAPDKTDGGRDGESAAVARANALAADLAAARDTLQAEQRRSKQLQGALAEESRPIAVLRATVDELLRESELYKTESRTLRDSLAARQATLALAHHSLRERDAQLSALQLEHANITPTLEASARSTLQLDAELKAARAEGSVLAAELKTSRETVAELTAQINRDKTEVNTLQSDLNLANSQAGSYLELLRTREWRRGFEHNVFRELDAPVSAARVGYRALESERDRLQGQLAAAHSATVRLTAELATRDRALLQAQERATIDAQRVPELTQPADLRHAQHATQTGRLSVEQPAQIERLQSEADQRQGEVGVLMQFQELRHTVQDFEAEIKRLREKLAAKDAAAAVFEEENRQLLATLERTRGALEEHESNIRRLERLKSPPGEPAAEATSLADAAASGVPERLAELRRIDGEETKTYVLAKRTRIGRGEGCELQINSISVSRQHALVTLGPRDTVIEDLDSTNGVFVNGRKVRRHVLSDGDAIQIGKIRFFYVARQHGGPPHNAEPTDSA